MIEFKNIKYRYPEKDFHYNFSIPKESICGLIGPNGSGKTTLFSLLAGFIKPYSGDIFANNKSITLLPPSKRDLTILFQEYNLFEHLTIEQNMSLWLKNSLKINNNDKTTIDNALNAVGLSNKNKYYPHELSGGQQARAGLCRCLLSKNSILLLDEPFAAIERKIIDDLILFLKDLHKSYKQTIIVVSHSMQDIKRLCDHVLFIEEGKNVALEKTDIFFNNIHEYDKNNILGLQ